jgi:hypothetical protein
LSSSNKCVHLVPNLALIKQENTQVKWE